MGTQGVQTKGALRWLVRWAFGAGPVKKIFVPAALVGPVFLIIHFFISFVPIAPEAGQAIVPGRPSLFNMCLRAGGELITLF
jgi:hypothetical protein